MNSPPTPPKCRIAVVGLSNQRVARVISLLHQTSHDVTERSTKFISPLHSYELTGTDLPKDIPSLVEVEWLPCVATFDTYKDHSENAVKYLVKLEYHGEYGTLVRGKSLVPFFDEDGSTDGVEHYFSGIAGVAVGCGIDADIDIELISSFFDTLSTSCRQVKSTDDVHHDDNKLLVECIKCNPEYRSMKEENDAYREMSEAEKKKAIVNQTIGPGKMAKFVYEVAQKVVSQRWAEQLSMLEHQKNNTTPDDTTDNQALIEVTEQLKAHELSSNDENKTAPIIQPTLHIPDLARIRYACKRCRTVLFGEADLEDPPHAQSLHSFRKKSASKTVQGKVCANHMLASPLPWMTAMDDMEGKLHCFHCKTKIGHYSWTGAQCSCGTWVTPAIMVPMSKVDEMLPNEPLFLHPYHVGSFARFSDDHECGADAQAVTNDDRT